MKLIEYSPLVGGVYGAFTQSGEAAVLIVGFCIFAFSMLKSIRELG